MPKQQFLCYPCGGSNRYVVVSGVQARINAKQGGKEGDA